MSSDMDVNCTIDDTDYSVTSGFVTDFCAAVEAGLERRLTTALEQPKIVRIVIKSVTNSSLSVRYEAVMADGRNVNDEALLDIVDATLMPSMGDVVANEIARRASGVR
ncbi:MAG: hypothetical protein AAGG69_04950 [Pseudomonadota bacterium]